MPSFPRSHVFYFLLPLYLRTGSDFASQNLGWKSLLCLKEIMSFSVSTFYQLHAPSAAFRLYMPLTALLTAPHHMHTDTPWNLGLKLHRLPWKSPLQYGSMNCSFMVCIYLVSFQSTHLNQINYLLRGSQELIIDTSHPTSFNPSNIRLVSHQDNNPICKSATFIR